LPRLLWYALVGGVAALINFSLRFLCGLVVPFEIAVAVAGGAIIPIGYLLNQRLVFRTEAAWPEFVRFAGVAGLAMVLLWLISIFTLRVALPVLGVGWHAEEIAHLVGIAAAPLFVYYLHKQITFSAWQEP
jgi:putative flippase GtrA